MTCEPCRDGCDCAAVPDKAMNDIAKELTESLGPTATQTPTTNHQP